MEQTENYQTVANHVPNDGRSRTKRLKIKGTKLWKITNQAMDDQVPNVVRYQTMDNYQTMTNHVPNDGRSRTKRLKIKGTKTMENQEPNDGPNGTKR
ncbi:hypothetical protein BLOT_014268 [Blomia tropicalis]|nr:hypothetical protein BLOT_014268 [Blomia tropicalis]